MLNNKKLGIRLVALLMTILMAVAIFAGCTDKDAQAKADAAQSQADAANAAAAAANNAAQSAAQAAADLAAQLAAAQAAADAAKAAASKAAADAAAAQSNLNSYMSGDKPVTGVITNDEQKKVTDYINSTVLGELSQLKVKYLTIRYLWYTDANLSKISKLFDNAYLDVYRATTIDGVKGVVTKLAADAAAVANIVSDANAIQGQIQAFGDVDTDLFTTQEANVVKARTDYMTWLIAYKNYFMANGLNVEAYAATVNPSKAAVDAFVLRTFTVATTTLSYAESKIVTLKNYAGQVSAAAYAAISAVWGKTAYADIKGQSALIEAAYNLYKIFMTANGGDGKLVTYTDVLNARTLTGEQFVKQYVLVLYDKWFEDYKNGAVNLIYELPAFFANNTNPMFGTLDTDYLGVYFGATTTADYGIDLGGLTKVTIADNQTMNELNKVAVLSSAEFYKLTYSGSFKGSLSLEDSFLYVDNCIAKTMTDMATLYYNIVAVPTIQAMLANLEAPVRVALTSNLGYLNSTDSTWKSFNVAFANEFIANVATYKAEVAKIGMKTFDQLKATTNIEDLRILATNNYAADHDITTITYNSNAALAIVLKAMNDAVKSGCKYYATSAATLSELKEFYDFRRTLAINMLSFTDDTDAWNDTMIKDKLGAVRTALGGTAFTEAEVKTLDTANTAIVTAFRTAVMALKYDSYSAMTYQAERNDSDGVVNPLYYSTLPTASSIVTIDGSQTTVTSTKKALTVQVDKIVVAKDAVVKMYAESSDKILANNVNLVRTYVNNYIDQAVTLYNTNYPANTAMDTVNLTTDINNYIAYLKGIAALNSIGAFDPTDFSLENDKLTITDTTKLDEIIALGYVCETVDTNTYIFHVKNFGATYTADDITKGAGAYSYKSRVTTKVDEYRNVVSNSNAYTGLQNVRLLAINKDDQISNLNNIKKAVVGTWDEKTSAFTVAPLYTYDYYTNRKVMYLSEVDKVYNKLAAAIKSVTMLDEGVTTLDSAKAKITAIIDLCDNGQDGQKAAVSKDDYSFKVAYARYYAADASIVPIYDWAAYNAQ